MDNQTDKVDEEKGGLTSTLATVTNLKKKVVFPPSAMWYKTNATASRDDMWAYHAGQSIVLVKPKVTHTRIIDPLIHNSGINGGNVTSPKDEDVSLSDRVWPTFEVFGYQREHYSCLSFCQSAWDFLPMKDSPLVTGCKEGYVKIWNVTTGECVMYYDLHKSKDKNVTVTCVDWSVYDPKIIYSMDEEGVLVSLYLPKGKLKSTSIGKICPTSLHASPHQPNIIAFGAKGGVVYIAQTDPKGKNNVRILHKVRHDEEIVATLWCPKLGWRMNRAESSNAGSILASSIQSSKAPTIRLWSNKAEDRGIYHVWEKERHGKPFRNFTPLLWATDPNSGLPILMTSSRQGHIIAYSQDSMISDTIHDVHRHSSIFGLVQCGDIIWSTSYEPVIVGFNLRTMQVSCVVPTFKGICSIAPSPSVGSVLAIGASDACIRVMDFTSDYPQRNSMKPPLLSIRMRSKIMALAWHPKKDNVLGFGTDDGILGTFKVQENNKNVMQFDHRVSGVVYAVDWGPPVSTKDSKHINFNNLEADSVPDLNLYACGGNSVFLIHPSKPSNPLINVSKIIDKTNPQSSRISGVDPAAITVVSKASDIRWSPDFALLAVGYNDGRIELYTPPFLQLKCWIKCHSRAVQFLSWRNSDFIQAKLTPEYNDRWFASTSNDATVRLFNLKSIFEKDFLMRDTEEPKLVITSQAKLASPSDLRIISCAWSPHDPNLLVTVSYDSTAIIWNITDGLVGVPIARYYGHTHRLVACAFHPINKYEVVTASDEFMYDCTMHVWDYRHHPYDEQLPTNSKHSSKSSPVHIIADSQKDIDEKSENEPGDDVVVKKNNVKEASNRLHIVDRTLVKCMESNKPTGSRSKGGRHRTLLPSTANVFTNAKYSLETELRYLVNPDGDHVDKIDDATSEINGRSDDTNGDKANSDDDDDDEENDNLGNKNASMIHLGLLGNYGQCVHLMKAECQSHASKGNWEKGCLLASWMGDTDFIERAVDEGHVTETIITLAKSMSKPVYKKACQKYAQKLVLQEDIMKAVTFLLQGGWKKEAIDLLMENKLFRDALALLMTNPSKADGIKKVDVLNKWLHYLVETGNFEVAAKVYCSMGQHNDALSVIEKRDAPYAWKAAMFLANQCNNEKKLKLIGFNYVVDCVMKECHQEAKEAILKYSDLKWLMSFVQTHELIFNLSNEFRDASTSESPGKETKTFKMIMLAQLDVDGLKSDGVIDILKETILTSITQNKNDAQVILIKSLLLKFLDDPQLETLSVREDYLKLCEMWLKEKEPFLYAAYISAFESMFSD